MDEFKGKYTYFADEEFDFESIMREFGSGGNSDSVDYGSVGTVHFGLEDDDIISSFVSSEDAVTEIAGETEPELTDEPTVRVPDGLRFEVSGVSDDSDDDEPRVSIFVEGDEEGEAPAPEKEPRVRNVRRPESFKEAAVNPMIRLLAVLSLKIRQSRISLGEFMNAEDEDLGEELPPEKASKFYERHIKSLASRCRLSFALSLVLIWLSYGLPVSGALRDVGVKAAVCTVLLLTVMLCGLDIITEGLTALGRKRPDANSLIAVSAVLCVIDGFIIAMGGKSAGLPFSAVPALTLSFSLLGSLLNCRGCRSVFGTLAVTKKPYTVTANASDNGNGITLKKSCIGTEGFVRRTEEAGPDEIVYGTMSPFIMIIALVLSIAAAAASKSFPQFAHILSGIFVFGAPATMLIAYPLPNIISVLSLKKKGAAVAGWSGLFDIGMCRHIVVTDSDLFSEDNIRISSVRIFTGSKPSRVISLAGSIISASGSAIAPAFAELMISGNGTMLRVDNFEPHEGGGLVAMVDGTQVFCGSASFMHLMGVQLPEKYSFNNCIYVSENKVICGMFMMEYSAAPTVKNSLATLIRSQYHPIFALRDFNMTPKLISLKFDTATDGFDFPSFKDRYAITDEADAELARPAAIVSRKGLDDFVCLAEHARDVYRRIRICVLISVLSTVIGIAMMFILSLTGKAGVVTALTFSLVWLVPVIIIALTLKT